MTLLGSLNSENESDNKIITQAVAAIQSRCRLAAGQVANAKTITELVRASTVIVPSWLKPVVRREINILNSLAERKANEIVDAQIRELGKYTKLVSEEDKEDGASVDFKASEQKSGEENGEKSGEENGEGNGKGNVEDIAFVQPVEPSVDILDIQTIERQRRHLRLGQLRHEWRKLNGRFPALAARTQRVR